MITLTTSEVKLAITAFSQKAYVDQYPLSALRGALANGIKVQLVSETVTLLGDAIEAGIANGAFSRTELPEVKRLYATKLLPGRKCEGGPIDASVAKPKRKARQGKIIGRGYNWKDMMDQVMK